MNLKNLQFHIRKTCSDTETRILIEDIAGLSQLDLITAPETQIPDETVQKIQTILTERAGGKPLSKILGSKDFYGRTFKVNQNTLDPRPETEILIDHVLAFAKTLTAPSILDLGTGTGCIPITLQHEIPTSTITAADISAEALAIAKINADELPITFIQSDWFQNIEGGFDIITSNPPYIDTSEIPNLSPEVKEHDPILALDGGKNGLEPYKIIFSQINKHLNSGGRAFLEIGHDQCGQITRLAENYRIRLHAIHSDLAGIPRVVEISCGDK